MGKPTRYRPRPWWAFLASCAVLAAAAGALAQAPGAAAAPLASSRPAPRSPRPGVWTGGIGSELRKGTWHAGFALGAGSGTRALGGRVAHDLALATARFGWVLGGLGGRKSWYHGNPELLLEPFAGEQTHPSHRSLYGITPVLRYQFIPGGRWVPFVDGGVGLTYTTIRQPDLSTRFEFNVQLGTGTHYFLSERQALTVQYRWLHLSNAGIKRPNNGVNTQMLFAGVDWFY